MLFFMVMKDLEEKQQQNKLQKNMKIHSAETNILNAIQHQLNEYATQKLTSFTQLRTDILNQYFDQFKNQFHGMCLCIDHIEILSSVKKQFFLYSLLEWVKQSTFPILFIGITTDLLFSEKLEKRVKSRYTHIPLYFFQFDCQFAIEILKKRFEEVKYTDNAMIIKQFLTLINSKEFLVLLKENDMSYLKLIQLFRVLFALIYAALETYDEDVNLFDLIDQAKLILFPNIKLQLCKDLNQPEYMILLQFYSLIMQKKPQIYFNDILQNIQKRKIEFSTQKHNVVSNFSPQVFNKALDNLIRLNIIQLQNKSSKNLEQNQLILTLPLDDVRILLDHVNTNQPEFIYFLST